MICGNGQSLANEFSWYQLVHRTTEQGVALDESSLNGITH